MKYQFQNSNKIELDSKWTRIRTIFIVLSVCKPCELSSRYLCIFFDQLEPLKSNYLHLDFPYYPLDFRLLPH